MKLSLNQHTDSLLIHSCVLSTTPSGEACYRIGINADWYQQSVLVTPQSVALWEVDDVSALRMTDFQQLADMNSEVVLLGVGTPEKFKSNGFPAPALTQPLMPKRIGFEVMDTAAACRTYNLLVSDGRKVVAALLL